MPDEALAQFPKQQEADPCVLGAVLSGSRTAGRADAASDYHITLVLTEEALQETLSQSPTQPRAQERLRCPSLCSTLKQSY